VRLLVTVEYPITRGDLGLKTALLFGTAQPTPYYYLFLALTLASLLAIWQILHSRVGSYLRAIRDDEEAASVMGLDTFKWKRAAFVISAAFAAVAGGFQGHYIGLLSPTPMKFNEMAVIIIMVISGGFRTFSGPVLGAVFIELLSEELRAWGEIRMVLFAILVIVVVRAYPSGLRGICVAAGHGLSRLVPPLAPLLTARRPED
jgi:branched-chain amino acid transport system permease protein